MATPVGMPKLGMTMREGRVVAWACALGDRVEKGAAVVVIESEKSEVEIEAAASGVLRYVYVEPGATVPCGTLLGAITPTVDEPFDAEAFRGEHDRPEVEEGEAPSSAAGAAPVTPALRRDAAPVTPAARARARELGIDVATVSGTGPGGRVTKEDVEAAAAAPAGAVRLEVVSQGIGEPLVLLPGFGCDVSIFARQAPVLATRFRVLGVNPRGIGSSAAPSESVHTVADAAADVAALLDRPAHLVGASLGAAVAIELALARPDLVRSLVLVTPFVEAPPRLLAVLDAWCRLAAEAAPETVARAIVPWMLSARTLGDPGAVDRTVRGLATMARRTPATTLARQAAGVRAWSGTRRADLRRITVRTLVLGAGEDLLTPAADAVAAAIPGARLVVVAQAGHAVVLEAGDEVNAELRHALDAKDA